MDLRTQRVEMVVAFLRQHLTEERTDEWIDLLLERVDFPRWVPRFLVRKVLDSLLPERLLDSIETLLRRASAN